MTTRDGVMDALDQAFAEEGERPGHGGGGLDGKPQQRAAAGQRTGRFQDFATRAVPVHLELHFKVIR